MVPQEVARVSAGAVKSVSALGFLVSNARNKVPGYIQGIFDIPLERGCFCTKIENT